MKAENLVRSGKMEHTSTGENLYLAAHPAGKRRFQAVSNTEFAVREWYFELCDTEVQFFSISTSAIIMNDSVLLYFYN